MTANIRRISWFAIFATFLAISSHLFFGSIFANTYVPVPEIIIKDKYTSENNSHDIKGRILVPSRCHDLTVRVEDFDADTIVIVMETWQQPYRECTNESVSQPFEITFFAPESVKIRTIVDGEFHPTRVLVETK
jgi:hypothetical protein